MEESLLAYWPIISSLGTIVCALFFWNVRSSLRRVEQSESELADLAKSVGTMARDVAVQTANLAAHLQQDQLRFDAQAKDIADISGRFDVLERLLTQPRIDDVARSRIDDLSQRLERHGLEIGELRSQLRGRPPL